MTEQAATKFGKRKKWIMCPTCRQRTDLENVAFVVEKHSEKAEKSAEDLAESTISVQGSYGTKVSCHLLAYGCSMCSALESAVTAYFVLKPAKLSWEGRTLMSMQPIT